MQERNPEPREPNSFIISSKHACPLLQIETLYLPGLFAMQTFLKKWSGTKHSLPLLARHAKLWEPHGEFFPNVYQDYYIQVSRFHFFIFFGLGSVSQFLQLLGSYPPLWLWFSLNYVFSHLPEQKELILCCRGLPGVFINEVYFLVWGAPRKLHLEDILPSSLQFWKDEDKLQAIQTK